MPTFHMTMPGGEEYEVDAPDETAAIGALSQMHAQPAPAAPAADHGGVMGMLESGARALNMGLPFSDRLVAAEKTWLPGLNNGQSYDANLAAERAARAQLTREHPIVAGAGAALGGLAVPFGAARVAAQAASLGAKALAAALGGAGVGAAQGLSDAPDWSDARGTLASEARGAGFGFGLGGAMPLVAAGIGRGYSALADALSSRNGPISNAANQHLLAALQADGAQQVQSELRRLGGDAMLADAGPALLGKAQGAALNSDEGRSVLARALSERNAAANQRLQSDFNRALGPAEDPQLATNAILAHRGDVDARSYPQALGAAPPVDTSGVLARLGQMITGSEGMERRALTSLRDALMENGPTGALVPKSAALNLHKIKGELDNVIQYDAPGLGVPAGAVARQQGALRQMRGELNAALEAQVPGYAAANRDSAALARRAEAVGEGTSLLDSGKTAMTPEALNLRYGAMEPGERAALAKGARGEIERLLDTRANDLVAGRNIIKGEGDWNRARLGTVFGLNRTGEVIDAVDREAKFRDTFNKVVENSQTAQRQAAMRAMKPDPSSETPFFNPNSTLTGMASTLLVKKPVQALYNAVVRQDPTQSYGEIARILAARGGQRDRYVSALADALARQQENRSAGRRFGNSVGLAAALAASGAERIASNKERSDRAPALDPRPDAPPPDPADLTALAASLSARRYDRRR
ncbi:hypothetical protein [Methylocella sp.]|uniref:hypothetical protein n=1 Tax=Methylocella sp. TaxID=1978226 RepID=UPI0035AFC1CA